jgi:hypothetical protein
MPYVTRDERGRVTGLSLDPAGSGDEFLPPQHPEVLAFLFEPAAEPAAPGRFLASDLALIRVVEDLVAVLIEKRLIAITDLPAAAQDKLLERRSLRVYLGGVAGFSDQSDDVGGKII